VEGSCEHGDEPSGSLKLLGISWMAAQLAAFQEGLSSVHKYVSKVLTKFHTPFRKQFMLHYEPQQNFEYLLVLCVCVCVYVCVVRKFILK
jgi:hypothetical protein